MSSTKSIKAIGVLALSPIISTLEFGGGSSSVMGSRTISSIELWEVCACPFAASPVKSMDWEV